MTQRARRVSIEKSLDRCGSTGPSSSGSGPKQSVGIDDIFPRGAAVEVRVALRRLVERDDSRIDRFRNTDAVMQNGHHQRAVVLQNGSLPGRESVRLGPPETEAQAETSFARSVMTAPCPEETLSMLAPASYNRQRGERYDPCRSVILAPCYYMDP